MRPVPLGPKRRLRGRIGWRRYTSAVHQACVRQIEGEIDTIDSGTPQLVDNDFEWDSESPSTLTLIAEVLEANAEDHDLLVDAGFGEFYVLPDGDVSAFKTGDIITFTARRFDLLEILE